MMIFVERVRNKSTEKIQDPAEIRTQDLLNTSQTLLPLSHLDPWQRGVEDKSHKQLSMLHRHKPLLLSAQLGVLF